MSNDCNVKWPGQQRVLDYSFFYGALLMLLRYGPEGRRSLLSLIALGSQRWWGLLGLLELQYQIYNNKTIYQ